MWYNDVKEGMISLDLYRMDIYRLERNRERKLWRQATGKWPLNWCVCMCVCAYMYVCVHVHIC